MKKKTIALVSCGGRSRIYAENLTKLGCEIIAVAEPHRELRAEIAAKYGIPKQYDGYSEMFSDGVTADGIVIGTTDKLHFEPTMTAIGLGYKNILLEKPISPSLDECFAIEKASRENGVNIQVCHVLRYTEFYTKIHDIIASGEIGDPVVINHTEGVGTVNMAHSFVRGVFRKKQESSPMIFSKCCHDTDLLLYLIGRDCIEISSFGGRYLFRTEMAPKGSADRCMDCSVRDDCRYNCLKLYDDVEWIREAALKQGEFDDIQTALEKGPYGRCVYRCDNDVVDHQTVNMRFDGGVTATLTMTGFLDGRVTDIGGTKGRIHAEFSNGTISVYNGITRKTKEYRCGNDSEGGDHGGGDFGMSKAFYDSMLGGVTHGTGISNSVQSHVMCQAAEKAMIEDRVVRLDEMR